VFIDLNVKEKVHRYHQAVRTPAQPASNDADASACIILQVYAANMAGNIVCSRSMHTSSPSVQIGYSSLHVADILRHNPDKCKSCAPYLNSNAQTILPAERTLDKDTPHVHWPSRKESKHIEPWNTNSNQNATIRHAAPYAIRNKEIRTSFHQWLLLEISFGVLACTISEHQEWCKDRFEIRERIKQAPSTDIENIRGPKIMYRPSTQESL